MLSRQLPFIQIDRTAQALIVVWLVITAFIGYLFVSLIGSRQDTEQRVRDQAMSYARLVDEHASATFDRANIALLAVTDHLNPSDLSGSKPLTAARRTTIEKLLRSQLQRTPGIVAMPLTNARGEVIADPLGAPPGTSLSDRKHFQILKHSSRDSPLVSQAVLGRVSGKWGVILGRRIDLPDGSFGGMISSNLGLDANFTYFYSTLALGKDGAVSLRDPEDRLLVRYPVVEQKLGKPIASSGLIKERLQAGDPGGVMVLASAIDGIERVFAFRRLQNYPIYAAVGLSLGEALVSWRRDRDVAVLGALMVILAGGFITVALWRQDAAEKKLKALGVDLEQKVWQRTAQLRSLSKRLTMTEEKERQTLSQDLHDDLGQILAMVKLKLSALEKPGQASLSAELQQELTELESLVDQANRSVRSLSLQLSPPVLHQFGLVPALEWLAEEFHRSYDLKVHVSDDGSDKPLDTASSNALFRAVRELLINVHKHATVGKAEVDVSVVDERLVLSVSDCGIGFDVGNTVVPSAHGGYGLFSVRERISYIGGEMHIDSSPGNGTVIVLTLPLERRSKWRMEHDTTAAG